MKKQAGFTLVELVVVIAILGILAATALPRFIDIQSQAKVAAMQGLASNVSSAANLARAAWLAAGGTGTTVQMDAIGGAGGVAVTVSPTGFPVTGAGGIQNALTFDATAFLYSGGTFTSRKAATTTCTFTYNQVTGAVDTSNLTATRCK